MSPYALTRERRREVCVHEAAHAVMNALGGAFVYRVAVAPEGATDWTTKSRHGAEMTDLWGVCSPSDSPAFLYVRWDAAEGCFAADRPGWRDFLRMVETHQAGASRELRRQLRAHLVGCLAGPAASQLFEQPNEEPYLEEGEWGIGDDIAKARAYSWLLPWRNEFEHLAALTVATLRRPDVWALVLRVADALEVAGELEEELDGLLPDSVTGWPHGPRSAVVELPHVAAWVNA